MILALLLAGGFAAAVPGQSHPECLKAISTVLERSGDPASDIANATVTACVAAEMRPQPGSIAASLAPDDQMKLTKLERELSADQVRLRVVRLRACAKVAGCDQSSIPQSGLQTV